MTDFRKEEKFFSVDELKEEDIELLDPTLRWWMSEQGQVREEEVRVTKERMRASIRDAHEDVYVVARDRAGGSPAGVMGFGCLDARFFPYRSSIGAKAAGLLTAFISPDYRGRGLGKVLIDEVFHKARTSGCTEVIWSSNPRYRETAWKFYTVMAGDHVGTIDDFFFPGSLSPVWRKSLRGSDPSQPSPSREELG
jgi:GNAT superfamily N-acetyltransferase